MGYGFKVWTGDKNVPLADDLLEAISEIRIEQELSKATKFAIRFDDDLCSGKPKAMSSPLLKPGTMIAVLVPDESNPGKDSKPMICLVRGPITKHKASAVLGGPASWLEVHGEDRRIEMDRESKTAKWSGKGPGIVEAILSTYQFDPPAIKQSDAVSFTDDQSLNQSSSDLKLIDDLCRQLGYEFWFSYTLKGSQIVETPNFKPSPDFSPAGSTAGGLIGAAAGMLKIDQLTGDNPKTLKLSVADKDCSNLTAFDLDVDVEKATEALLDGVDAKSGKPQELKAKSEQPPVDPKAKITPKEFLGGKVRRFTGAGSTEDRASEAKSILADEAWFVTATASANAYKLPGIVNHHDLVSVEGAGFMYSGKYQVSKVLHVINGWGHMMDITLRRNSLPGGVHA